MSFPCLEFISRADVNITNTNGVAVAPELRLAIARAFLDEAALYSGADEGQDVDGVRLMTMHAAKGLEFDVVFVPGCVEGLVPLFDPARGDKDGDLEEETRLFFVSMTRAKRELRLVHTRMHAHQGAANRWENKPSRFLQDILDSGHAEGVSLNKYKNNSRYNFKRTDRLARVESRQGQQGSGVGTPRQFTSSAASAASAANQQKKNQELSIPREIGGGNKSSFNGGKEKGGGTGGVPQPTPLTAAQMMQQRRANRR